MYVLLTEDTFEKVSINPLRHSEPLCTYRNRKKPTSEWGICSDMATYKASVPVVFHFPYIPHEKKRKKKIPCSEGNSFPLQCHSVCASLKLLPACYLEEHIPCRGGHPSERRVALIRRCHLLGAGTDLAWRERRSDSPATKISPFRHQEERPAPHPPPLPDVGTREHKVKKSSRSERTRAAPACQRASTWRALYMWRVIGGRGGWRLGQRADKSTV